MPQMGPETLPKVPHLLQPARQGRCRILKPAGAKTLPGLGTDCAISIVACDRDLQVYHVRLSSHKGLDTAAHFFGCRLTADTIRGGGLELQQSLWWCKD